MQLVNTIPNSERWLNLDDLPNEKWKYIPNTHKYYMISTYGRMKSLKRNTAHERILKTRIGRDGYYYANLSVDGVRITRKVHRAVAEVFIPDKTNFKYTKNDDLNDIKLEDLVINHIDGIKTHNNIENLEWCTSSYNQTHACLLGLTNPWMKNLKGKDCPFSRKIIQKTIDGQVIKIWDSMSDVKRELNIPVPHLVRVCKGQRKSTRGYKWCYFDKGGGE